MADSHHEEIARLEALYASNPGGRVFTHLAEAYRKAGRLDRAREIAQDGLRRHDDYASAHVVLGRILLDMGRRDDAAAEFQRVLQLDPENRIALRGLGDYERERGAAEEALRHYRQLEQLDPGDEDLSATIAALQTEPAAPAPPPPPAAPVEADFFESYAPDPFAGHTFGDVAGTVPPAEPAAPGAGGMESGPPEFEPLPLSMDWSSGTGGEAPDLLLDWDLDAAADGPGASPAEGDEEGAASLDEAIGEGFRLDVPEASPPAEAVRDAAAEWRELEEAASAALPPADYEALPPADHEALPPADHEVLPPADHEVPRAAEEHVDAAEPAAADEGPPAVEEPEAGSAAAATAPAEAESAAAEDADWSAVTYEWQEPEQEDAALSATGTEPPGGDGAFEAYDAAVGLPPDSETEVYTETLAELYRAQGFHERAIEVYRALLADRPGDQRLLMKLRELEGVEAEEAPLTPHAASWQALADTLEAAGAASSARSEAAAAAETERPEPEWVENVEAAWTGGEGAVVLGEGLYSPPAEEGDAAPTALPLARWLDALLDWRPTRRPGSDPEEELLLLDEVVEEAETVDVVGLAEAEEDVPRWETTSLPPAVEDERDAYAAEGRALDAAEQRAEADERRDEAEPSSDRAAESAEPFGATGPRTFEQHARPEAPLPWEDRADAGAASGGTSSGAAEPERLPWEEAAAAHGAQSGSDAPGPGGVGNPFEAHTDAIAPKAEPDGTSEDEDDDDLEMFRSWLQSLRR